MEDKMDLWKLRASYHQLEWKCKLFKTGLIVASSIAAILAVTLGILLAR